MLVLIQKTPSYEHEMFAKIKITLNLSITSFHFSLSLLKNSFNTPLKTLRCCFTSCTFNNIRPEDEQTTAMKATINLCFTFRVEDQTQLKSMAVSGQVTVVL